MKIKKIEKTDLVPFTPFNDDWHDQCEKQFFFQYGPDRANVSRASWCNSLGVYFQSPHPNHPVIVLDEIEEIYEVIFDE